MSAFGESHYAGNGTGACVNCERSPSVHWPDGGRLACPPKNPFSVTDTRASRIAPESRPEADFASETALGSLAMAARDTESFKWVLLIASPMWLVVLAYVFGPLREHGATTVALLAAGALLWWFAWWRLGVEVRVPSIWEAAAGLVICALSLPLLLIFGRKPKPTAEELRARLVKLEANLEEAERTIRSAE